MTGLLTRDEFIAARDEIALARMLERGAELWVLADAKLLEARALRKRADNSWTGKRDRELLMHEYDGLMREWASMETEIGDIQRDQRYIEWRRTQKQGEVA